MNRGRQAWSPRIAAAAALLALLLVSCTRIGRYEVLSFFFDGVPTPPGVQAPAPRPVAGRAGASSVFVEAIQTLREQAPKKPKMIFLSVHKPVAERKCQECHDEPSLGTQVAHDATLCDRCHQEQRREQGWDHGPINLGTCIPCHVPHRSTNEHLLSKPVPELCLNCHTTTMEGDSEYHVAANFNACTECHDPHRMY